MFCPKCSQEQVSVEVRFCSRCGFQLGVVKALLSDGAPQTGEIAKPDGKKLRMRDVTIGAFLMAVLAVIGAAITMDLPAPHTGRIFVIVVMWIGLAILLNIQPLIGYFLRGDSAAPTTTGESLPSKIISKLKRRNKKSLPEANSIPAADLVFRDAKTAQMAPPPSITEPTTNLLDKN